MKKTHRRWAAFCTLLTGTLFASSCDGLTGAILDTIGLAFGIVDIWA